MTHDRNNNNNNNEIIQLPLYTLHYTSSLYEEDPFVYCEIYLNGVISI